MADETLDIRIDQERDGYLFSIMKNVTGVKKKRISWNISFLDSEGERPLIVPPRARMREYCSEQGEFSVSQAAKIDRFSAWDFQLFVPHKLFQWIEPGKHIILRARRMEENSTAGVEGDLQLLVGQNSVLIPYSEENYFSYLLDAGTPIQQLLYAERYLETPGAANCGPIVEMLTALCESTSDGRAEFNLYKLYFDPARTEGDEETAKKWLKSAVDKGFEEAKRASGAEQVPKKITKNTLSDCLALAQEGNSKAQFRLYEHYAKKGEEFDPKKALEWLVRAAENGLDEAVQRLEEYFLTSYFADADAQQYLALYERAAQAGSNEARQKLFEAYHSGVFFGRNVKKDKKLALQHLKMAAEGDNIEACYRMWQLYEDGNDLLLDENEAASLLERAAEQEHPAALCDLGQLYVLGRIVKKDGELGLSLLHKAAQLDSFEAQLRVFEMTLNGRHHDILLDIEPNKAYQLLKEYACMRKNPIAQTALWESYLENNPVMLTRGEALAFLSAAAESDYLPAMFMMACIDAQGVYKDVDAIRASELLELAAKKGSHEAQLALYELYYTGSYGAIRCDINKERAYKWLTCSAAGSASAQYRMWEMYSSGNEMDLEKGDAYDLLFSSVRAGHGDSLYAAAELFAKGKGVPVDVEKALYYLNLAAKKHHAKSMYRLYEIYSSGSFEDLPVEKDMPRAVRMLTLSAEKGFLKACSEVCALFDSGTDIGVDKTFREECRARLGTLPPAREIRGKSEQGREPRDFGKQTEKENVQLTPVAAGA